MEGSFWNFQGMSEMTKTTSDSILGVIRKFELLLTRRAVKMLGGGNKYAYDLRKFIIIKLDLGPGSELGLRIGLVPVFIKYDFAI